MSLRETLEKRKTILLKEPLVRKFQGQVFRQNSVETEVFWKDVERATLDEVSAHEEYRRLAREAERLGFSSRFVEALLDIAKDESKHRGILEDFKARGGF